MARQWARNANEQVGLDAPGLVMKDGAQAEVTLEGAERLLDKAQLHGATPNQLRVVRGQIGAQQVAAFARDDLPQPGLVEVVAQRVEAHLHRVRPQRGRRAIVGKQRELRVACSCSSNTAMVRSHATRWLSLISPRYSTCRCATLPRPWRRLSTIDQERCVLPSLRRTLHFRNMPAF